MGKSRARQWGSSWQASNNLPQGPFYLFTRASCKVQPHFSALSLGRVRSPQHSWQVPQTLYMWDLHGCPFLEVRISGSGRAGPGHEVDRRAASCRAGSTGPDTGNLSSHLARTHYYCLTSVEKALSRFMSVLPSFTCSFSKLPFKGVCQIIPFLPGAVGTQRIDSK